MDCLASLSREVSLKLFTHVYRVITRRAMDGKSLDGGVGVAIGHDSQKTPPVLADELAEQLLRQRMERQGIPESGQAARGILRARMGRSVMDTT